MESIIRELGMKVKDTKDMIVKTSSIITSCY